MVIPEISNLLPGVRFSLPAPEKISLMSFIRKRDEDRGEIFYYTQQR